MSNDIRLVISDLDGTLLSDLKHISAENRRAVNDLAEAGILFTIATGRMETMMMEYVRQLSVCEPIITFNGAMVRAPASNTIVYQKTMQPEAASAMFDHCFTHKLDFLTYTDRAAYYQPFSERVEAFFEYNRLASRGGSTPVRLLPAETLVADNGQLKHEVLKFFVQSYDPDVLNEIAKIAARYPQLHCVSSMENSLDIMAANVSKGEGLRKLAEHYDLSLSQIAAFGDHDNDVPMLEEAGLSIAMSNGTDLCKSAAEHIAPNNNLDGFARMVRQFIL
ncbi:MAG: Cof-type HAD-IIB family hydrolase [Fastidiosipilaceae bacterium]|jgi:Cof subfamily protein (haloacid dehalogenase superfamily)